MTGLSIQTLLSALRKAERGYERSWCNETFTRTRAESNRNQEAWRKSKRQADLFERKIIEKYNTLECFAGLLEAESKEWRKKELDSWQT